MLRKLFDALMRLGVTDGVTFRAVPEDGVGVFLEPNPRPTRQQVNVVPAMPPAPRKVTRRASGRWTAKPLHVTWE